MHEFVQNMKFSEQVRQHDVTLTKTKAQHPQANKNIPGCGGDHKVQVPSGFLQLVHQSVFAHSAGTTDDDDDRFSRRHLEGKDEHAGCVSCVCVRVCVFCTCTHMYLGICECHTSKCA